MTDKRDKAWSTKDKNKYAKQSKNQWNSLRSYIVNIRQDFRRDCKSWYKFDEALNMIDEIEIKANFNEKMLLQAAEELEEINGKKKKLAT